MRTAESSERPAGIILSDHEARVLAVLIEKSLTQAGGYPMTLNSITLGANQKQNREPVVEYTEGEVSAALRTLSHKGLIGQSAASAGARAVRFEHRVVERLHWDRREQAVMAELMLRGRQTAGELRTRASRMTPLPDLPAVGAILESLKHTTPPYVEELPREPGRSANRFRHLLGQSAATNQAIGASGPLETHTSAPSAHAPPSRLVSSLTPSTGTPDLTERVARLEAEAAEMRTRIAALERQSSIVASEVKQGVGHEFSTDTGYPTGD